GCQINTIGPDQPGIVTLLTAKLAQTETHLAPARLIQIHRQRIENQLETLIPAGIEGVDGKILYRNRRLSGPGGLQRGRPEPRRCTFQAARGPVEPDLAADAQCLERPVRD